MWQLFRTAAIFFSQKSKVLALIDKLSEEGRISSLLSLASMHVSAIVQYHNLGQLVAVINMYHDFVVHSTGTYISRVYYFELGVLYLQHSVSTVPVFSSART